MDSIEKSKAKDLEVNKKKKLQKIYRRTCR